MTAYAMDLSAQRSALDISALLLRVIVGGTMLAHGWNHFFGGGRLPGTTRWFSSIGMRHARLHAVLASVTEVGAGALLLLGLLTPLASAAVVGCMLVALVANHIRNGFFIFRPGEGYEYVLMIIVVAAAIGASGGGSWSLDNLFDITIAGWPGLATAAVLGGLAGALALGTSWRRPKSEVSA
ncbi:MAG: rane protein [Nocardia sp.]|uniref:DoxX family protein n=1 Tax=Nocardia sp. TaxID=1821 RepID=UPI00261A0636|nr:DoxX family protein [Nocardia sp.]MCU1648828.1 rane protein [Nocardia sp.]